ncbi:MAG: cyclic nucleotide-binding domain-containing protein [Myxococcales bacterium]|nr:cyclic nucleotide-binding domain-containing protein [Myxococcales bacterium]
MNYSKTMKRAEEAIRLQRRMPYALGPMILALRTLLDAGMPERAAEEALKYAHGLGAGERAGHGLLELVQKARTKHYVGGEAIVREGDRADELFVLTSGSARVEREGSLIARLGRGQSFGEAAVLGGYPRTASVIVEGGASVVAIRRAALFALGTRSQEFKRMLRALHRNRVLEQLVPDHAVLGAIEPKHRHLLFNYFESRTAYAGTDLVREGGRSAGFYVLGSGQVRVWRKNDDAPNRREVLAELGPGDVFGEISLLQDVPATATVEATEKVNYFVLWREAFDLLMEDFPDQKARIEHVADRRRSALGGKIAPPPLPAVVQAMTGMNMVCPVCGEVSAVAKECPACGADVEAERRATLPLTRWDFSTAE